MKHSIFLLLTVASILFLANCASFTAGAFNATSAKSDPAAIEEDSIHITVKALSPQESKRLFDCNIHEHGYQPLSVSISNQSKLDIVFTPDSIPRFVPVEQVLEATDFNPGIRLVTWSLPWLINIAFGYPVYYGILWPIIGVIDMGNANKANNERADFFHGIEAKSITLMPGKEFSGIVFIRYTGKKGFTLKLIHGGTPIQIEVDPY